MKPYRSIILSVALVILVSCSTPISPTPEKIPPVSSPDPVVSPEVNDRVPIDSVPVVPVVRIDPKDPDTIVPLNPKDPDPFFPLDPKNHQWQRLSFYPALTQSRDLVLRLFPRETSVSVLTESGMVALDPVSVGKDRAAYDSDAGAVLLEANGFLPAILPLQSKGEFLSDKLERPWEDIRKSGETETEWQPKSVRFAPDGESVYIANLGVGIAMSQYSVDPPELIRHFNVPEKYRAAAGFVESIILPARNEIWISQMTLNTIHVFDLSTSEHLAAINVSGIWPKVLLVNRDESRVYVSCWDSETVVEINPITRKETRSFSTDTIPRGMVFSPDQSELLIALFGSSGVERINIASGLRSALYDAAPGQVYAMRHIVHDKERQEYYITAMGIGRVYRLSETGEWLGYWNVGDKPNTCAISPDGKQLYVSCRGPNNPDTGYLTRGYEFGKVFVINLDTSSVRGWFWGRDQTTGLDVSPKGTHLAITNFLTPSLEIYRLK